MFHAAPVQVSFQGRELEIPRIRVKEEEEEGH